MSDIAVKVEGLGKWYQIGELVTMRDLPRMARRFARSSWDLLRGRNGHSDEEEDESGYIWALRDINFEIKHGEVVGFIGHNGAGKSTLLKVLSRVTAPTEGTIDIYGRVGALLEVGTGFHPELTGRENVYLNGAILGMSKAEIDRKFEEIVEFAGVAKFIDTPVKRYSSGMRVRLGFAVAAHLEPEILIVDEVLAVGDADFQERCIKKMDDVASGGRTVLFVSHNMASIQQLCSRAVVLNKGRMQFEGRVDEAVDYYLGRIVSHCGFSMDNPTRTGTREARFTSGTILDRNGNATSTLVAGLPAALEFEYEMDPEIRTADFTMSVRDFRFAPMCNISTKMFGTSLRQADGRGRIRVNIPRVPFIPGKYHVSVALTARGTSLDHIPNAMEFRVASSMFYPTGLTPERKYSAFLLDCTIENEAGTVLNHENIQVEEACIE